jgi:hypothetical protein
MESVVVREEVPEEEAAVKPFRALKKRHRDWHLAVRRRGQPKKWIQSNGGPRKKLAAACRGMTRHAIPSRREGHTVEQRPRKKRTRGNVLQGTRKGRTFGRRRRAQPEFNNGIRILDLKEWLRLGNERTSGRICRKTI